MMSFSRRMGFEKEPLLQKDGISGKLENRLWNTIHEVLCVYGKKLIPNSERSPSSFEITNYVSDILIRLFADVHGITIDSIPQYFNKFIEYLKDYYFNQERNKQYDFIEFIFYYLSKEQNIPQFGYFPSKDGINDYLKMVNRILKEENSAYILLNTGDIVPITEDAEIECIEEALEVPYENVKTHIKTAIQHFKEEPKDYRNSIKESISAVEAMCCELTGDSSASLGKAIKKLKDSGIEIHPSLEQGFDKIYGYTSDESGIRHSLDIDSVEATFDDAKYMLVSCSAFINYLIGKSQETNP